MCVYGNGMICVYVYGGLYVWDNCFIHVYEKGDEILSGLSGWVGRGEVGEELCS